jgi:hypothetical protein
LESNGISPSLKWRQDFSSQISNKFGYMQLRGHTLDLITLFLHYCSTVFASAVLGSIPESIHNRGKLVHDIKQFNIFFIEFFATVFTVPDKTVLLPSSSVALDYQTDCVGRSAG